VVLHTQYNWLCLLKYCTNVQYTLFAGRCEACAQSAEAQARFLPRLRFAAFSPCVQELQAPPQLVAPHILPFLPQMTPNRTDRRNAAMAALVAAAPSLFARQQHKKSKQTFMEYQIATPCKSKRPGTSFALLPNAPIVLCVPTLPQVKGRTALTPGIASVLP
jgi:hypothetical protein